MIETMGTILQVLAAIWLVMFGVRLYAMLVRWFERTIRLATQLAVVSFKVLLAVTAIRAIVA